MVFAALFAVDEEHSLVDVESEFCGEVHEARESTFGVELFKTRDHLGFVELSDCCFCETCAAGDEAAEIYDTT